MAKATERRQTGSVTALGKAKTPRATPRRNLDVLIADAATRLFAQRGFSSPTIREIAQLAGVTLPALYRHYTDKRDLYHHCCKAAAKRHAIRQWSEFSDQDTDLETLYKYYRIALQHRVEYSEDIRLILRLIINGETSIVAEEAQEMMDSAVNAGDCPTLMLNAPGIAARKALARAGLAIGDIDLWEVNEAFAVVTEKFVRDLAIDSGRVNVNGGSIALGHPIGATGAVLIGTLLDELERQDKQFGLVTMCAAGGMAPAVIIERV